MLLGKKLFELMTPYHRVYLTIITGENFDYALTLPAKQTALFFLNNQDRILLDDLDELSELVWLDYDLLDPKKGDNKFIDDFNEFKTLVKKSLLKDENFLLEIERKVVYGKNCQILAKHFSYDPRNVNIKTVSSESENISNS